MAMIWMRKGLPENNFPTSMAPDAALSPTGAKELR